MKLTAAEIERAAKLLTEASPNHCGPIPWENKTSVMRNPYLAFTQALAQVFVAEPPAELRPQVVLDFMAWMSDPEHPRAGLVNPAHVAAQLRDVCVWPDCDGGPTTGYCRPACVQSVDLDSPPDSPADDEIKETPIDIE